MAGELTIQRVPRGLLDLFAMRGPGLNPSELQGAIYGVCDLLPFYLLDKQEVILTNTNNITTAGFYFTAAAGLVPDNEMWLLSNLTGLSNALTVGQILRGRMAIQRQLVTQFDVAPTEARETTTGAQWLSGWDCNKTLRPGDRLGVYISEVTGYAASITVCATIYRLKI